MRKLYINKILCNAGEFVLSVFALSILVLNVSCIYRFQTRAGRSALRLLRGAGGENECDGTGTGKREAWSA